MENGDMDVDMDIDLGPIGGVELQVNEPIRSILIFSVAHLTFVDRHPVKEVQLIFSLLISASTLATYLPPLLSMRLLKRFTFEAWTTSQQKISTLSQPNTSLPCLQFASNGSMTLLQT